MIPTVWRVSSYKGYLSVIGENEQIRVEIVPERGSKLVSMVYKPTGREWIYSTETAWDKPLTYGMDWQEADRSGWDELFPTISPCLSPDAAYSARVLPDHGEVWSLPWEYEIQGNELMMRVKGVQIPYHFNKTYRLEGCELQIHYELHNTASSLFSYIWAPHCLLKIEAGMKLWTADSMSNIFMRHSLAKRFETDAVYGGYPVIQMKDGKTLDLSVIEPKHNAHAEKYWFVDKLSQGRVGLTAPHTGESFRMEYSAESLPYLAIWSNYGGYWGDYNLAIEPSTSYLDDVESSFRAGKVKTISGNESETWYLKVLLN